MQTVSGPKITWTRYVELSMEGKIDMSQCMQCDNKNLMLKSKFITTFSATASIGSSVFCFLEKLFGRESIHQKLYYSIIFTAVKHVFYVLSRTLQCYLET